MLKKLDNTHIAAIQARRRGIYRGQLQGGEDWAYGYLWYREDDQPLIYDLLKREWLPVKAWSIGAYTTIDDRYKYPIFEFDYVVLTGESNCYQYNSGYIIYDKGYFGVALKGHETAPPSLDMLLDPGGLALTVIGNIIDMPQLLKNHALHPAVEAIAKILAVEDENAK